MKKILVTGSSGLIGGEVSTYFSNLGWEVHGVDNNMREFFFGAAASTRWNQNRLLETLDSFSHHEVDIRDREGILGLVSSIRPNVIVHAAAQPSHDRAAAIPFIDFETNALGTLNLLEACRQSCCDSPFVYLSTNKVYGDAPNSLNLVELQSRWDFADAPWIDGIPETFNIDQSKHSLFGASKLAADILVQEYGRYFGMPSCILRGGCLTGPGHSGVELHGFLSYLIKCNVQRIKYTGYGYKLKQVRDNIHSHDVARFIGEFVGNPRCGEVYNIGGGKDNSISLLEAFSLAESLSGIPMNFEYSDNARSGDHIVYYSNLSKIKKHYPNWSISKNINTIFEEIYIGWRDRA